MNNAALLRILAGDEENAIAYLREAVERGGETAALLNDLAFAHLTRNTRHADPFDAVLAYEEIDKALELDPSLPDAHFNKAVILEKLGLTEQAFRAWTSYLEANPDSLWSQITKRKRSDLANRARARESWEDRSHRLEEAAFDGDGNTVRAIVSQDSQHFRLDVEDRLFAAWARALHKGNVQEASRALKVARSIGDALLADSGDALIHDAALEIERAVSGALTHLIEGHLRYEYARKVYQERKPGVAKPFFAQAEEALARSGSPFALWAQFYRAACIYYEKDHDEALRLALSLRRAAQDRGYVSLAGRAAWLIGLIQLEKSEPARALDAFREALVRFERTSELGHQGSMHSLIATTYEYMGERRGAWKHHCIALAAAVEAGDQRLPVILGEVARAATREDLHALALALQNEAVEVARTRGGTLALSEAYWWRADIHHRAGRRKEAIQDLEAAKQHSFRIADDRIRRHTWAGIAALEGAIRRFDDPAAAVELLSQALGYYVKNNYRYPLVEIYLHRGQAFLALEDAGRAEGDFLTGISEYEEQRRGMENLRLRIAFFEQAREIFEEMIRLQAGGRDDGERAFQYADRTKARALWDAVGGFVGSEPSSLSQQDLQKALPPDTLLISYYVLPEEIIRWAVDTRRAEIARIPISRVELRSLVESIRAAATKLDLAAFRRLSNRLYLVLLGGLDEQLGSAARVVFIPDKELSGVPFAALSKPGSGRFLVEARAISVAPSVSIYVWATRRAQRKHSGEMTALIVGDPLFDRQKYPELPRLAQAEAETQSIAALFPQSVLLTGPKATEERFLAEVGRHELIHFSGHALPNLEAPYLSKLILAPSGNSSGELSAQELHALSLERPILAVLSGCATMRGAQFDLEGSTDPARALLAAGVPAVVGTLWTVDDRSARDVVGRFYVHFRRGEDAISALRAAQVAAIRAGASPASWASFQLTGAAVEPMKFD